MRPRPSLLVAAHVDLVPRLVAVERLQRPLRQRPRQTFRPRGRALSLLEGASLVVCALRVLGVLVRIYRLSLRLLFTRFLLLDDLHVLLRPALQLILPRAPASTLDRLVKVIVIFLLFIFVLVLYASFADFSVLKS